jgi:hypothetical protein
MGRLASGRDGPFLWSDPMKALALIVAFLATPAAAQVTAESYRNVAGQMQDGLGVTLIAPIRATSTSVGGSVAVASTFQTALAASNTRKGCSINNTSAAAELIYLGATGSANAAAAIPLPAGGSFNCGSFQGLVLVDNIAITSTTQGATYVVVSQ